MQILRSCISPWRKPKPSIQPTEIDTDDGMIGEILFEEIQSFLLENYDVIQQYGSIDSPETLMRSNPSDEDTNTAPELFVAQ